MTQALADHIKHVDAVKAEFADLCESGWFTGHFTPEEDQRCGQEIGTLMAELKRKYE